MEVLFQDIFTPFIYKDIHKHTRTHLLFSKNKQKFQALNMVEKKSLFSVFVGPFGDCGMMCTAAEILL